MESDKIIENLTNHIMKLELLVSNLIEDKGRVNGKPNIKHIYNFSDYKLD